MWGVEPLAGTQVTHWQGVPIYIAIRIDERAAAAVAWHLGAPLVLRLAVLQSNAVKNVKAACGRRA